MRLCERKTRKFSSCLISIRVRIIRNLHIKCVAVAAVGVVVFAVCVYLFLHPCCLFNIYVPIFLAFNFPNLTFPLDPKLTVDVCVYSGMGMRAACSWREQKKFTNFARYTRFSFDLCLSLEVENL